MDEVIIDQVDQFSDEEWEQLKTILLPKIKELQRQRKILIISLTEPGEETTWDWLRKHGFDID